MTLLDPVTHSLPKDVEKNLSDNDVSSEEIDELNREFNKLEKQLASNPAGLSPTGIEKVRKEFLESLFAPHDLDSCLEFFKKEYPEDELKDFKALKESKLENARDNMGAWVRENLLISPRLRWYFNNLEVMSIQEMALVLMTAFHRHLHEKEISLEDLLDELREISAISGSQHSSIEQPDVRVLDGTGGKRIHGGGMIKGGDGHFSIKSNKSIAVFTAAVIVVILYYSF